MNFGVQLARRPRRCDWYPETIIAGQACLIYYDMGKTRLANRGIKNAIINLKTGTITEIEKEQVDG